MQAVEPKITRLDFDKFQDTKLDTEIEALDAQTGSFYPYVNFDVEWRL